MEVQAHFRIISCLLGYLAITPNQCYVSMLTGSFGPGDTHPLEFNRKYAHEVYLLTQNTRLSFQCTHRRDMSKAFVIQAYVHCDNCGRDLVDSKQHSPLSREI